MKMITLEAEKAQQIDESLDEFYAELAADSHRDGPRCLMLTTAEKALSTIRAARAQADHIADADKMVHEPVARIPAHPEQGLEWLQPPPAWGTKLYAAPVRTKDLTDDEIAEIHYKYGYNKDYTRAVIAAFKEKNK